LQSYSLYVDSVEDWWNTNTGADWRETRDTAMALLQKESELQEIVQLVGPDALPDRERITLETTRMIREDFLQQNAYHEVDTYCAPKKQYEMLKTIILFHTNAEAALDRGAASADIISISAKDDIGRMKYLPEAEFEVKVKEIQEDIIKQCSEV
jgi:V/A-type H+-transporting ATPase subunit A